jgi:hypothetical protein
MTIVADVYADLGIRRIEHRISEVARLEVELFPESRRNVWNVILSVLPEIRSICIDDGGGVVIHARRFFLVDGNDDHHAVLLCKLLHQLRGRTVRNMLRRIVPAGRLLSAEIRSREDLLHADYLHALFCRLFDERYVLLDVRLLDGVQRLGRAARVRSLDEAALYEFRH